MIVAQFFKAKGNIVGFIVSGHAAYAAYGEDIVCAGVTSVVQFTANAITEVLLQKTTQIIICENKIEIKLPVDASMACYSFMEALLLHLNLMSGEYPGTIEVINSEV
ncbi:MAG: ribosomal-processing cysteine protease Prp [Oscillospiraceae bacterium]